MATPKKRIIKPKDKPKRTVWTLYPDSKKAGAFKFAPQRMKLSAIAPRAGVDKYTGVITAPPSEIAPGLSHRTRRGDD